MTNDPARAETGQAFPRLLPGVLDSGESGRTLGVLAIVLLHECVVLILLRQDAGRTAVLAAIAVAWLGSAAAAIPVAWAIRQSPATLAAAALASLGLRLAVTLVAAWLAQSNVGLPSEPSGVALAQFLLLGLDTAAVGLFRRVSGG